MSWSTVRWSEATFIDVQMLQRWQSNQRTRHRAIEKVVRQREYLELRETRYLARDRAVEQIVREAQALEARQLVDVADPVRDRVAAERP